MLPPADILAAKLMVQMGYAETDQVLAILRSSDLDEDLTLDLIARLTGAGTLQPEQVK